MKALLFLIVDEQLPPKFRRNFDFPSIRNIKREVLSDRMLPCRHKPGLQAFHERLPIMQLIKQQEAPKSSQTPAAYPQKLILRHGVRHVLLDTKDIVYCYSNKKVVFVVAADHLKYMADKNLLHLAADLDPNVFFKVSRTHIINFHFVHSFLSHERNRLKVELKNPQTGCEDVIVSQTRVHAFRRWIYRQL